LPTLKEILDDTKEWKMEEENENLPTKDMKLKMEEIIKRLKFDVQSKKQVLKDEKIPSLASTIQPDNLATNSSTKPKRSSDDQDGPQERLFPLKEDFWKIFDEKFLEFKTSNETFLNKSSELSQNPDVNGTAAQIENVTMASGIDDFFRTLLKDDKLRQTVDDVASLATKNHVAILKTYGVDERLDKSGNIPT
jgi:hypothetical protein